MARLNPFPDHEMYTLFVDGEVRFDFTEVPEAWLGFRAGLRRVNRWSARRALAPLREFAVYGSEVGRPCDDPFCCG
ncbi:hypothetical protein [Nocardia sp. NPDC057227]|uniref:hypothetical protein n=1 Tax=Nocardia sp. NPDC057227 TaxID=3346056 RepID=UPI00362F8EB6